MPTGRYARKLRSLVEGFAKRCTTDPSTGCWLWSGCERLKSNGKRYFGHRLSYELHVGPIQDPYVTVDRTCGTHNCVNPAHLRLSSRWPDRTVRERFDEKWTPEPNTGCWLWCGASQRIKRDGRSTQSYGLLYDADSDRPWQAHRLAWELNRGSIPDGLWVLHKCDTPPCVNVDHLWLGTPSQNTLDMYAKDRGHTVTRKNECVSI